MPIVTFATFCHPPHLERLHKRDVLKKMIATHGYPFDEVIVVHQRCRGIPFRKIEGVEHRILESEDYHPGILSYYGIPEEDPIADKWTHGPSAAHYWKWHCINHLIALKECTSDYIVSSDCDCLIIHSYPGVSWVEQGISILERERQVFCVSPNDGGRGRYDQNMSQQCFLVETARMRKGPLNLPWSGEFDAPGGPMQEYYFMLEGRIGRLLTTFQNYRYVLKDSWRYWHYNPWRPE